MHKEKSDNWTRVRHVRVLKKVNEECADIVYKLFAWYTKRGTVTETAFLDRVRFEGWDWGGRFLSGCHGFLDS